MGFQGTLVRVFFGWRRIAAPRLGQVSRAGGWIQMRPDPGLLVPDASRLGGGPRRILFTADVGSIVFLVPVRVREAERQLRKALED